MGFLSQSALSTEECDTWCFLLSGRLKFVFPPGFGHWASGKAALSGRFGRRTGFRSVLANAASLSTQRRRLFHALGQILQVVTQAFLHFLAPHDSVNEAVVQQELGRLKTGRQ